jgi:hypothetical protein
MNRCKSSSIRTRQQMIGDVRKSLPVNSEVPDEYLMRTTNQGPSLTRDEIAAKTEKARIYIEGIT